MGKLIEADALLASLRESRDRANVWLSDCREYGSEMTGRAEQAVMTFNECILRVKGAPTVDAVPVRHGRWTIEDCRAATYRYCCSNCTAHHRARYAYCPSCGAVMDGKDGEGRE